MNGSPNYCFNRKNKFPTGDGMVMLLVPLVAVSVNARRPASARKIAVLLQGVAARVRPRDNDAVAGMGDAQRRRTGGLDDVDQTPETAGQRITAAGHRTAGIGLTDGATDL